MAKYPSWLKDLSPADRKLAKGLLSGRYADIDENGNTRNKKAVEKFQRTYRGNAPNLGAFGTSSPLYQATMRKLNPPKAQVTPRNRQGNNQVAERTQSRNGGKS